MRNNWIRELFIGLIILLCLIGIASAEETDIAQMTWGQLQREARAGELLPLHLPASSLAAADVDGTVYGCEILRFQTWFQTADAPLWEAVGIEQPDGVITWTTMMDMAQAVARYNQGSDSPVFLLAIQPHRFPSTFAMMELEGVREQWDSIQQVICSSEPGVNALMVEKVLPIQDIGSKNYVVGIELQDRVYPLARIESRYLTIPKNAKDAPAAQAHIMDAAGSSPVHTGIIPDDMTYVQFCEERSQITNTQPPSEKNFEMWKLMQ